jgi:hypothetical protein
MYLHRFHHALATVDDQSWQRLLQRHAFWRSPGSRIDAEHQDVAFHILMHEGELADHLAPSDAAFQFDAIPIPPAAFEDQELAAQAQRWAAMHARNYGPGLTIKMGLYVIRAGGTLGFHIDGPVFLKGMRADLSAEHLQRGLVEMHASHRTILPLRFNAQDSFMICNHRAPLARGELFEFNNVLPHAYFNRGAEHAVLLVTTYLDEALLPEEFTYAQPALA